MTNHPSRSNIIQLDALDPSKGSAAYAEYIGRSLEHFAGIAPGEDERALQVVPHVELIRCGGERYWLAALRMMTAGGGLEEAKWDDVDLYDEQVAHAIKQIWNLLYPERKYIEVESRMDRSNGDMSAHVWWNHRKCYEQVYFSIA